MQSRRGMSRWRTPRAWATQRRLRLSDRSTGRRRGQSGSSSGVMSSGNCARGITLKLLRVRGILCTLVESPTRISEGHRVTSSRAHGSTRNIGHQASQRQVLHKDVRHGLLTIDEWLRDELAMRHARHLRDPRQELPQDIGCHLHPVSVGRMV